MADSMRDIKRRIKSVNSTKQITHAMELVASAKLRKTRQKADARRAYTQYMIDTMHTIAGSLKTEYSNVFLSPNDCERDLYIVITSDKGLAGGFNSNLLKFAVNEMSKSAHPAVVVSGNKGVDFFRRRKYEVLGTYTGKSENASLDQAREIGACVSTQFIEGNINNVYVIYNRFVSMISQKPTIIQLLPLTSQKLMNRTDEIDTQSYTEALSQEERPEKKDAPVMLFEPDAETFATKLIPLYIDNSIYGALLESSAGELASRRMAMENATDNADEIINALTLAYNRARQGAITSEIVDIVSGAEAIG